LSTQKHLYFMHSRVSCDLYKKQELLFVMDTLSVFYGEKKLPLLRQMN
jgi:hypothetical protein